MSEKTTPSLSGLNDMQFAAASCTEGPLLILAGAGSGKTRVLVHRIAHLIDDLGVQPGRILAITFTNKAAEEMRTRVDDMVGFGSGEIWVSTFHACCVRILRQHAEKIGYGRYFSIYDTDDSVRVMKEICHRKNIDTKRYKEKALLASISRAKDELIDPDRYAKRADGIFEETVARVYPDYQETLKKNNALDFDDLLVKTVELFRTCPEVLSFYQEKFRYIHVDEYQDTNTVQFVFVSMLADKYRNLCVVGDDDQSIYKFRGANIVNILGFEEKFPDATVIRLEQNYRSTKKILAVANAVIAGNRHRKKKTLWTDNEDGQDVRFLLFDNAFGEAAFVTSDIAGKVREGVASYRDFAVLYRTNAQSRLFEERLLMENIPYKVVGGVNFYSRMEIKDMIAYLKTIDNAADSLAVRRIVNVPKRGIGDTSVEKIRVLAEERDLTLYEALSYASDAGVSGKTAKTMASFVTMIEAFRAMQQEMPVAELLREILEKTGYLADLEAEHTEEADARIENLDELISKAALYDEQAEDATLSGFLEEVSLIADIDTVEDSDDVVLIMTLHASKGLEFPYVYIAGMEDGVFPGYLSIDADDESEMEEERRLAYVGMTRAKKALYLIAARQRMIRGNVIENPVSRFIAEIPEEMIVKSEGFGSSGGYASRTRFERPIGEDLLEGIGRPREGQSRAAFGRSRARIAPGNPYATKKKQFAVRQEAPAYDVGDRVVHERFGEGVVREITEGGRDYEVTVDFDEVGIKKMFASFANLQKR